jgi:NADH dehydrogenase [ubiquinone] 1 alpha subcomplex assembly factor 7
LARDALRAMKRYGLEPRIHLVESSTALKEAQLDMVDGAIWHHDLASVPMEGPVLLVANEFLDALPVRQLVMTPAGWRERMVVPKGDKFVCIAGDKPMDTAVPENRRKAPEGTILETNPAATSIVFEVAGRLAEQQGAALLIDYGYAQPQWGSTLQAVKGHRKADPFISPGEADLTTHVDFSALAATAQSRGAKWLGTVPQGEWLRALGIETRAESLAAFAPHYRDEILSAKDRLIGEGQMGLLFKVMGLSHPAWPDAVGF